VAAEQVRTVVRYAHGAKLVTFDNVGLARAVESLQTEDPPYECGPDLDAPPGRYIVRSRSAQLEGRTAYWYICLDAERGTPVAAHNCPARAANPRANIQCRHFAAAWLCWKAEQDERDPWLRKVRSMSESTALAPYEGQQRALQPYVPTREEVGNMLALAKVLMETKGAAIPYTLDSPQKVAAVIMAGRELGFEPMAALKNLYIVNGMTQPNAQAIAALIQRAGGDIVYHEMTAERCTAELVRPGRPPLKVTYTHEQATKAGLTKKQRRRAKDGSFYETDGPWQLFPEDMLVWKAVTRLGRRGAADIINGLESSMIRLADVGDLTPHDADFRDVTNASEGQAALAVDRETGEVLEDVAWGGSDWPEDVAEEAVQSEPPPPDASPPAGDWRDVNYADAHADKGRFFRELSSYQKAIRGAGGTVPEAAGSMTLGEVALHLAGGEPGQ
jgi:hypothetical protein